MKKLPKEAEGVVLTNKQKAAHFWFYYKWYIIALAIISIILAVSIHSCATKPNYDMTVVVAVSAELTDDATTFLTEELSQYCDDYNGDGEVLLNVYNCCFSDNTAGIKDDSGSRYPNFISSFTEPENIVYIIDQDKIDYADISSDIDTSLNLPDLNGGGIKLNGTELEKAYTDASLLTFPEDTYMVRRALTGAFKDNEEAKKNFDNAHKFITKFREAN